MNMNHELADRLNLNKQQFNNVRKEIDIWTLDNSSGQLTFIW